MFCKSCKLVFIQTIDNVIKLYIDPDSPEIWYDPNEKIDKTFIVIMFIVGIFTTLGGAFFLYVGLKYRPKEDWEG